MCGREEIEEVNDVAADDGDELHTADGVFRATSDDDDSCICAHVILPGELTPVTINGHLIGFHHLVEEALVVLTIERGIYYHASYLLLFLNQNCRKRWIYFEGEVKDFRD